MALTKFENSAGKIQSVQPNALQVSLNGLVMKAHPIILNDDGTAWMLRIDQISNIFWIGFPMVLSGQKLQMDLFQATLWHLYSFFASLDVVNLWISPDPR